MSNDKYKDLSEKYKISNKKKNISNEKVQISKVPAPFKPVSTPSSYIPPTRHKPEWKYWKIKTKIKLWEAAFLCYDIDPRNQEHRDIKNRDYEEVNDYLDLLKDNFNLLDFGFVSPPEVATWALDRDLDIPQELAALAKKPDTVTVVHSGKAEEPAKEENKQTPTDPIKNIEGKETRGVPKKEIISAFRGIHFLTDKNWSKALAAPPNWLKSCRVEIGRKGSKTKSALWNPVCIAIELYDKEVSVKQLEQVYDRTIRIKDLNDVFKEWEEWKDEWDERSFHLQPQNT